MSLIIVWFLSGYLAWLMITVTITDWNSVWKEGITIRDIMRFTREFVWASIFGFLTVLLGLFVILSIIRQRLGQHEKITNFLDRRIIGAKRHE